jgi:hypothetical protein
LVDGLQDNNNHQSWGLINYPDLEAINQYNVESSVPDARFGRSGATVNVGYKSGESHYHGTAFEYLRNHKMDSRNFFAGFGLSRENIAATRSASGTRRSSSAFPMSTWTSSPRACR